MTTTTTRAALERVYEEIETMRKIVFAARLVAEGTAVQIGSTPMRMELLRRCLKELDDLQNQKEDSTDSQEPAL